MLQQIIPPNIQYTLIKTFHQIYAGLIPLHTILLPGISVQNSSSPHGVNPVFALTTSK